jgi:microcystin degradation protein MlrC
MLRIAIASLMQETNTFSPAPTTLATFDSYYRLYGEEMLGGYGAARVEVPGFLEVLAEAGATPVPLLAAYAAAYGPMTRACFDTLVGDMEARLKAAGAVDGLLLALHGALVVEDQPDGDGEVIARMRRILPAHVSIGVSLDLHGHITPKMLHPNVFHVGYREYPHIDMYETGQRTARLLLDTIAERRRPVMALVKRPMLISAVCGRTTDGPLRPVVEEARRMEVAGEVLHASLFPVQPWLDVPDLGFAALICADGETDAAERAATKLADMTFARRHEFVPDLTPLDEAIRLGLASDGLTVIADGGDAPTGGAAADSAAVLRALFAAGADRAGRLSYLTLCDPPAVAAAAKAGPGATVTLSVGHAMSVRDGVPIAITGVVRLLSDGEYSMRDAGATGMTMKMGPTAVLAIGAIRLLLRSSPSMEWDTAMYFSQGLDPREAALVFVKSPAHFRVAYAPLAARILVADTPGPTCANMRNIPFRRVTRPLFPIDDI